MKTLLLPILTAAALVIGMSPQAEARPDRHHRSPIYISGHRSCGTPIYKQRYVVGYDRCGAPVWRHRIVHPGRDFRHRHDRRWRHRDWGYRRDGHCRTSHPYRDRGGIVIQGILRL